MRSDNQFDVVTVVRNGTGIDGGNRLPSASSRVSRRSVILSPVRHGVSENSFFFIVFSLYSGSFIHTGFFRMYQLEGTTIDIVLF